MIGSNSSLPVFIFTQYVLPTLSFLVIYTWKAFCKFWGVKFKRRKRQTNKERQRNRDRDIFSSVQLLSRVRLCNPMNRSMPGLPVHHQLRGSLRLTSIESVMPSSHLIFCRPLLLLPPIPPSIRVFSNVLTLHMRWPKYWSFSFSISPSKEHPGLISFRMDWLDLLAGILEIS